MNKKQIINYLKNIILLTLLFIVGGSLLLRSIGLASAQYDLYFLTTLFLIVSGGFHFILIKMVNQRPLKFVQVFLILTVAKILLYLTILLVYIFRMNANLKVFLVSFLVLYFSYTIFEVIQLTKYLKNKGSEEHLIK